MVIQSDGVAVRDSGFASVTLPRERSRRDFGGHPVLPVDDDDLASSK